MSAGCEHHFTVGQRGLPFCMWCGLKFDGSGVVPLRFGFGLAAPLLEGGPTQEATDMFVAKYEHRGYGWCGAHGFWDGPLRCSKCEETKK